MVIKNILFVFLLSFSFQSFAQEIYPESIVIYDPENKVLGSQFSSLNNYKYSLDSVNVNLINLSDDAAKINTELKVIIFPGLNHVGFTDGSIMVKYDSSFDFISFAEQNNLEVKKIFNDINFVVLKTPNVLRIKPIIQLLKEENGVYSARIDFIDPNYETH
tara:strand:- start:256 stop:738 length:483 start_codon:yes stop_codon:yes gene_type:complete